MMVFGGYPTDLRGGWVGGMGLCSLHGTHDLFLSLAGNFAVLNVRVYREVARMYQCLGYCICLRHIFVPRPFSRRFFSNVVHVISVNPKSFRTVTFLFFFMPPEMQYCVGAPTTVSQPALEKTIAP